MTERTCSQCRVKGDWRIMCEGAVWCDTCYLPVWWALEQQAEHERKIEREYADVKHYVKECARPEVLTQIRQALLALGVVLRDEERGKI